MKRIAALTAGSLLIAGLGSLPAEAAKKKPKPIKKSYQATAPLPDPTNALPGSPTVCPQRVPESYQETPFTAPAKGVLDVTLTGYQGDWDLLLKDSAGAELAGSGSGGVGGPENAGSALRKGDKVMIVACNFSGGPTGNVSYTFTFK